MFDGRCNFVSEARTAVPNLLRKNASGAHLHLIRGHLEIPNCHLNSIQHLSNRLLENQTIQGDHRHHRVVRVDADSMLGRHFSGQALQVD